MHASLESPSAEYDTTSSSRRSTAEASWIDVCVPVLLEIATHDEGTAVALAVRSVPYAALLTAVNRGAVDDRAVDITGLRLWDFGRCLARFVATHHAVFDHATALELGCGCGALSLSLACSARGATVVATDYSDAALTFARDNVAAHCDCVVAASVRVEPLSWRCRDDAIVHGPVIGALELELRGQCDFVLGCDLLYYKTSANAVFATAARLLRPEFGVFLFGGHARVPGTIASIREAAAEEGLALRFIDMDRLRTYEEAPRCYWNRTDADGGYFALLAMSTEAIERFVAREAIGGALRFDDGVDDESDVVDGVW